MNSKYDTVNILEIDSVENIVKRISDMGVGIIVIKSTCDGGYFTAYNGNIAFEEFYTKILLIQLVQVMRLTADFTCVNTWTYTF